MQRQQGMGLWTGLVFVVLLVFAGMVGLTVAPVYVKHFDVKDILKVIADNPAIAHGKANIITQKKIKKSIERQLVVKDIKDLDEEKDIQITREDGGFKVSIHYEVRKHIMFNADVVLIFDDHVIVAKP